MTPTEIAEWRLASDIQNQPMAYCGQCQRQTIQVNNRCKHCQGRPDKKYPVIVDIKNIKATYPIDNNRGRFECEDCGKLFFLQRRLYAHYKIHNIKLYYTCRYCGEISYSYDRLLKHRKICLEKK
jgi:hypothetical protein